jgi:hypothetical protein
VAAGSLVASPLAAAHSAGAAGRRMGLAVLHDHLTDVLDSVSVLDPREGLPPTAAVRVRGDAAQLG